MYCYYTGNEKEAVQEEKREGTIRHRDRKNHPVFFAFRRIVQYNSLRMDGILLLNKPAGMTSFAAVSRCRRIFHEKKTGHTGTLDPEATGLLIILLGKYTKLLPYAVSDHKRYSAEMVFGVRTDTDDIWGSVTDRKEPGMIRQEDLQKAADAMIGRREQIPPMVSAVRVNGKKLYEYARKGQQAERKPRPAEFYSLKVSKENDVWHLDAEVSGGTYIRTLIRDLGDMIGEYAVMSALKRTGIEHLSLADACTLEEAEKNPVFLEPRRILRPDIPAVECECVDDVLHGRSVLLDRNDPLIVFVQSEQVLAAYEKRQDGRYHCARGLL